MPAPVFNYSDGTVRNSDQSSSAMSSVVPGDVILQSAPQKILVKGNKFCGFLCLLKNCF